MLPSKSDTTVCCAHPAYQIHDELVARDSGVSRLLKNSFAFGDEAGVIAVVDEDVPDEPPGGA